MTVQRLNACPACGSDQVAIYTYESGSRCVECDTCYHRSPIMGTKVEAARAHNALSRAALTQDATDGQS